MGDTDLKSSVQDAVRDGAGASQPGPACRFCGEPLRAGAVYCVECKQFQTRWTRWQSQLTLPAILGALPLLALVYAFVRDHTTVYRSEVHALPVQCAADRVVVGLTNSGNRPAVVAGGAVRREAGGAPAAVSTWSLASPSDKGALIVEPAKPLVEAFAVGDAASGPAPLAPPGQACVYHASVKVLDYGRTDPREEAFTCACPAG